MKFYNVDLLNCMGNVYFETSRQECFELKETEQGYLLTDITPPELEMNISGYRTFNIPNQTKKEMIELYKWNVPTSEVDHFYGIVKGGRFGFHYDNPEETLLTKGTIEKLYTKLQIGNLKLNFHLFDWAGKKIDLNTLGSSYIIHTSSNSHHVTALNGKTFFEGKEIFGIHSVMKQINAEQMLFTQEFDVSVGSIYLNRPFIIMTSNNEQSKVSIINEMVDSIEQVKN